MILEEVDENTWGYMEAHGSFHGIYWWNLQSMKAMEASTSTNSGNFYVLPWQLSLTSMEVNLRPPTSMEVDSKFTSAKFTSMEVCGNFPRK